MAIDKKSIPPAMFDEVLTRQVAALALANVGPYEIARQLNITRGAVKQITDSAKFRDIMVKTGEVALKTAVADVKNKMSKLASKAIDVVEHHLDEQNLEGAKVVFKILGVDQAEEKVQDSVINVILPGKTEKVIEVINDSGTKVPDNT